MNAGLALALGVLAGFFIATALGNHSQCCASLGKAALGKYGVPDLGAGIDSVAGGLISELGLA